MTTPRNGRRSRNSMERRHHDRQQSSGARCSMEMSPWALPSPSFCARRVLFTRAFPLARKSVPTVSPGAVGYFRSTRTRSPRPRSFKICCSSVSMFLANAEPTLTENSMPTLRSSPDRIGVAKQQVGTEPDQATHRIGPRFQGRRVEFTRGDEFPARRAERAF